MSEVNPDGSIKLTDKGENPRATATLDGHTYRTSDGMSYRFISLSTPNTFVIQIQGSGQNCLYILARLTGDIVALYYPPDTGDATLDPTILATGATPDEGFGKTWKFTSDAQVLSAMAAFAQHLPAVPAGVRRVAFTDAQIAQLDRDIAEALFKFGERSFLGQGVPQDYGKAREWFQKAAAAGNADGMAGLGFCYRDGQGVDRDFDQAAAWYEKAAAAGNADAMAGLGLLYEHGWGVYRSSNEAAVWYQRAAAAGNADGKSALARLHTQQAADEASQSWVNQHPVAAGLAALLALALAEDLNRPRPQNPDDGLRAAQAAGLDMDRRYWELQQQRNEKLDDMRRRQEAEERERAEEERQRRLEYNRELRQQDIERQNREREYEQRNH